MRIIFLVHRINLYRYFMPLIEEGLKRGYVIECWHDYSENKAGSKWYNFPYLEKIPDFGENNNKLIIKKSYYGKQELSEILPKRDDIDFVVSVHLPAFHLNPGTLMRCSFKWIGLMSTLDIYPEFRKIKVSEAQELKKFILFPFSDTWAKILNDYLKVSCPDNLFIFNDGLLKSEAVGNPEFDFFKDINPEKVREKYAIPKDKSVFLYLPFSYGNRSDSAWEMAFAGTLMNSVIKKDGEVLHDQKQAFVRRIVYQARCLYKIFKDPLARRCYMKGINEGKVFNAVRRFCDKNGLYLVAKPRLKYSVSDIVKRRADLMVWDTEQQQNPPILKELLSVSKAALSFCSFSVLTAAFGNVFHLNVSLPDKFFVDDVHNFWFSTRAPSLFHFPGACESWDIERVINELDKTPLEKISINPAERRNYVKRYAGFDDYSSSARFFDALKRHMSRDFVKL